MVDDAGALDGIGILEPAAEVVLLEALVGAVARRFDRLVVLSPPGVCAAIEIVWRRVSSIQGSSVISPSFKKGGGDPATMASAAEAIQAAARSKESGTPWTGSNGKSAPRARAATSAGRLAASLRDRMAKSPAVPASSKGPIHTDAPASRTGST